MNKISLVGIISSPIKLTIYYDGILKGGILLLTNLIIGNIYMYALARGKMKIVDTMRNHQQHTHSSRSLKTKNKAIITIYIYIHIPDITP